MGQLAADDLTSYDKSLDGLDKSFVSSKFLKQDAADAVTKLAGVVIHAVSERYRRKKLESIIAEHNGHVRALAFGLQTAIDTYVIQLKKERGAMNDYYSDLIRRYAAFADFQVRPRTADGVKPAPPNPLPILPLKERWDGDQLTLQTKIEAAESYRQLLTNIADGHQALYANRQRLDAKDVLHTALNYASTAQDLVNNFKKAF